jgi:PucR family transcriptional regulator, purine catabolism regulatory protein
MLPTLAEVLDLDAVRAGSPRVVAAADRLDTLVRWVHAIELADAARLLHGGELVLSTGIALPDDPGLQARYVGELAGIGVTGLAIELGRRYSGELPAGLVAAARARRLPLIVFDREVPFVEITEAVHARIIDSQLTELRAAARLHEVFTELSVAGAGPEEIVRETALLAGRPVILADLSHTVLACAAAGADTARLLDGFAARSRQAVTGRRTGFDEASGWLITQVGARGEDWGRVVMACGAPPAPLDYVLIERAATTLALGRLHARQRESLERQAHRTLISAILAQPVAGVQEEAATRARALGLPVSGRQLIALVVRLRAADPGLSAQARVLEVADAVADACRAERVPAIVGSLDDLRAGALLSFDRRTDPDPLLAAVSLRIRELAPPRSRQYPAAAARPGAGDPAGELVIAVGSVADAMRDAPRSFAEAQQVADAAAASPDRVPGRPPGTQTTVPDRPSRPPRTQTTVPDRPSRPPRTQTIAPDRPSRPPRTRTTAPDQVRGGSGPAPGAAAAHPEVQPFLRLADLRLGGLLQLLRGDPRLQSFAEREVGQLLAYDAYHGTSLTSILAAYLDTGGNKAQTAARTHLARPTLYERLSHIERVLGVSLESARSRTSLHVALLAQQAGSDPP